MKRLSSLVIILVIALIALGLRLRAVDLLPIDYDEDDYLRAGQQYATSLQSGDLAGFTQENYRSEHPPLTKMLYGAALSFLPPAAEIPDLPTTADPAKSLPQPHLKTARTVGAVVGAIQALALALVNPIAGLFLAVHTWEIKYTTQVMLESVPGLTSLLVVIFFRRAKGKSNSWLWLSAAALGLTAAGKYTYCLAGVAVLTYWLWTTVPEGGLKNARQLWRWLSPKLLWILVAFFVFFLADPYLWPDPIHRLKDSLFYHGSYAQSEAVKNAGFPSWQPLVWLFGAVPWHPGVFIVMLDLWITILSFFGLKRLWARYPEYALWLGITLAFLLVWPTKWPQYILMLTAPLSLAAGEGFQNVILEPFVAWILSQRARWQASRERKTPAVKVPSRRRGWNALPWILPGVLVLLVITFFPLLYQVAMSLTDFNVQSIRDGIQGGVFRETWLGLTGQVQPVFFSIGDQGRVVTQDHVEDQGKVTTVEATRLNGKFSTKDVHFAGPVLFSMLTSFGSDFLVFNILWTILTVGLQTLLGLAVAMALNRKGILFAKGWRTLFILPWAIPEFVGAMICLNMFEPTHGWLSLALKTELRWYDSQDLTMAVLVFSALWLGWSFMMLASTAALKMLPKEIYDASAIDGANPWQTFKWVTWPLILPLLAPALIIRAIFAFNQFYLFYVMGGPLFTMSTLSFYLFDTTRGPGSFSISAAINLFTMLVLLGIIFWMSRWSKAQEEVSYATN